ncbi:MAG: hypothetical protein NZ601_00235 [candidate division WOR-3 bacterium]|nr:hypothetical protein [candidate division WOR-3 bacterium]
MKSLKNKLKTLKELYVRYEEHYERLKRLELEVEILYDLYLKASGEVAELMQRKQVSEVKTEDGEFKLKRVVDAKIVDRACALDYDERYGVGIFQKSICGMRLRAWAKEMLAKGVKLPDFVVVTERWTVDIK